MNVLTKDDFKDTNNSLDFAKHELNGLVALFGYQSNVIIYDNKKRAMCMCDCIIDIMNHTKVMIEKANINVRI